MTIDRNAATNVPSHNLLPEGRRWGYVCSVSASALDAEAAIYSAAQELLVLRDEGAARAFAELDGGVALFERDVADYGEDAALQWAVDRAQRVIDHPCCPRGALCAILDNHGVPVAGGHRGLAWTAGGRGLFLSTRPDGAVDIYADVPAGRPHGLTEGHDGRLSLTGAFALVEISRGWVDRLNPSGGFAFSVALVDGVGNPVPTARLAGDDRLRHALRAQGLNPDLGPTWEVYEH